MASNPEASSSLLLSLCKLLILSCLVDQVLSRCYQSSAPLISSVDYNRCLLCFSINDNNPDSCLYHQSCPTSSLCSNTSISLNSQQCQTTCCPFNYDSPLDFCQNITTQSFTQKIISILIIFVLLVAPLIIFLIFIIKKVIKLFNPLPPNPTQQHEAAVTNAINQAQSDLINLHLNQIGLDFIDSTAICVICLEGACNISTKCRHVYHFECLREWAEKKMSCPACINSQYNPIKVHCMKCLKGITLAIISGHALKRNRQMNGYEYKDLTCEECKKLKVTVSLISLSDCHDEKQPADEIQPADEKIQEDLNHLDEVLHSEERLRQDNI